jgi:hypothetical protein
VQARRQPRLDVESARRFRRALGEGRGNASHGLSAAELGLEFLPVSSALLALGSEKFCDIGLHVK